VLNKIVLVTIVGSNRLYASWRSFPASFKKIGFLFFTLHRVATWPLVALRGGATRGHVGPIRNVKNKKGIFLKLAGNDLQLA